MVKMATVKTFLFCVTVLNCFMGTLQQLGPIKKMKCPSPPVKTCLDYLKMGFTDCGLYRVYDDQGRGFVVYCDMNSETGSAWTLIESFTALHKREAPFRSTPFKVDAPVREDEFNWGQYRLSLKRMTHLRKNSTHWRATCSYPQFGVDFADYARGKLSDLDIMTFLGSGVCKKVEYINIRGHRCSSCTAKWWSVLNSYHLHVDSSFAGCGLDARKGATGSEDNFGYYVTVNTKFRCTAQMSSSTQWWLGAYQ